MRARVDTQGTRDRSPAFTGGGRGEMVDEMIDDYVSWREARTVVAVSYENWRCSDRPDEKLAFSVYVAALDREERAAAAYLRAIAQVATALAGRQISSLEELSTDGPREAPKSPGPSRGRRSPRGRLFQVAGGASYCYYAS
jgi:hypothetical protein